MTKFGKVLDRCALGFFNTLAATVVLAFGFAGLT